MNKKVVCMVRGGEAGRDVQLQAIAYAQSHQLELVFVHVVNVDRFVFENEALKAPAIDELTWLARVILSLARRRALEAGIKAEIVILQGTALEQMRIFLEKTPAECVFIGAPFSGANHLEQRRERGAAFADQLHNLTGVDVIIADVSNSTAKIHALRSERSNPA